MYFMKFRTITEIIQKAVTLWRSFFMFFVELPAIREPGLSYVGAFGYRMPEPSVTHAKSPQCWSPVTAMLDIFDSGCRKNAAMREIFGRACSLILILPKKCSIA